MNKEELIKWFRVRFYGDNDMSTINYDEIIEKMEKLK